MANHWSLVLNRELENSNKIVLSSSLAVVLKDAFPKAKNHYLVVPKNVKIKNVFELSRDHLSLLDDMFQLAKKLIDSLKMEPKEFLIGFKLDPSMQLLNLHVISTDFVSDNMKKERHWTNYHTRIFLPYNEAYDQLKIKGSIEQLTTNQLNKARFARLICNSCEFSTRNFGDLKNHLFKHWEEKQISSVEQQQKKQENVTSTNGPRTTYHNQKAAAQQNVSLELPQTSSNVKSQPSIKERFEALNKVLKTFSVTTTEITSTTSDRTTTTAAGLNEDLACDQKKLARKENVCDQQQDQQNATLESPQNISNCKPQPSIKERFEALNKILETVSIKKSGTTDEETLAHKENVCEQQQKQQNATLESPLNISNCNPQPSIKERFEALNKILKTVSIKNSDTTTTTKPIYNSDIIDPGSNKDLRCDQETLARKENVCEQQQKQQNGISDLPQNNSNVKPHPSLTAEMLHAVSKRLGTLSLTTTESTPTTSDTTSTSERISDCDVKIDDQKTLEHKEQQNKALESSQNISNSPTQTFLKERFEALSKLLETDSMKETPTSDTTKTTEPIFDCVVNNDCNLVELGLKTDDRETLNTRGNVCEQQEEQQIATSKSAQPSIKERFAALNKILEEKDYAKAAETTITTPIRIFDDKNACNMIETGRNKDHLYHKESSNVVHNKSKYNHNLKNRTMYHKSHEQKQEYSPKNGNRSKNEYHKKPKQQYQRQSLATSTNQPSSLVNTPNTSNDGFRSVNAYHKKPDEQHQGGPPTNQPLFHGDTPNTSNTGVHMKKQYHKKPKQRYQRPPPAPTTSTSNLN